jgi:mannosyltransferase OCH1-like enzyme
MNIIQTWKTTTIPKHYEPFINSVTTNTSGWNYMFFTDEDIFEFMQTKMPEYLSFFNNLEYNIQKIDFFRYLAVYHYGGVYLDLDILIEEPLDSLYDNPDVCKFPIELENIKDTIITRNNFHHLIGNYAFYSPAGHPFLKKIIDNIVNCRFTKYDIMLAASTNGDPYKDVYIYCSTGPIMVTQSYIDFNNSNKVELIKPEPFYKNSFGRYGVHCSYGSWKS